MKTLPFRHEVINGQGEPMFIDFRQATPDDLDKVLALQSEIMEALPDKDLYAPFTEEESLNQLKTDICYIAECNGLSGVEITHFFGSVGFLTCFSAAIG